MANLEDLIDPEYGLQQDEWSLTRPKFGEHGQLEVIGWSGRIGYNKYYVLRCSECSQDSELFGSGVFRATKDKLGIGRIPCGCSSFPRWSEDQMLVRCKRKASELGHSFVGWAEEYRGNKTMVHMSCTAHGEWKTTSVYNLLSGYSCKKCGDALRAEKKVERLTKKLENYENEDVYARGMVRRLGKHGKSRAYLLCECKCCGHKFDSYYMNVIKSKSGCPLCTQVVQKIAYINIVYDRDKALWLKFGITNKTKARSRNRITDQNRKSVYNSKIFGRWLFEDYQACRRAETECKQTLECGVLTKEEMPDGYTETTWVYNLEKIIAIYEKHGGVRVDD